MEASVAPPVLANGTREEIRWGILGKISFFLLNVDFWISWLVVSQSCSNYEDKANRQNKVEQKDEKNKGLLIMLLKW